MAYQGTKTVVCSLLLLIGWGSASAQRNAVASAPTAANQLAQTTSAQPLSLWGAVRQALALSPSHQATALGVETARLEERKARGGLLPTVGLSASYSYMLKKQRVYFGGDDTAGDASPFGNFMPSDGIEMGEKHTLQGGLAAGMPLVAPQLWASLRLSAEAVKLAEESVRTSRVSLISEVRKAYLGVLLARASVTALQASYDNASANYRQIADKYKHGLVAEYDVVRMETQMKSIRPNLVAAENALRLAEGKLKVTMGLPLESSLSYAEKLEDFADNVYQNLPQPASSPLSFEGNSQLRTLDLQGQQLESTLKLRKAAFLPTLSLNFNYAYSFAADKFTITNGKRWSPFSTIGLQLDIPIYSGGTRMTDLRTTENQIRQLGVQRVALEQQLQLGALSAESDQRSALEQFVAAKDAVKTAERGYEIAGVRYRSGASTLLELNDAELALLQARLSYHQAIHNYMVSVFSLDELRGLDTLPEGAK